MSVIKVYDISSVEKVRSVYGEVEQRQKQMEGKIYTIEDIMLVRTTSIFPEDRIIKPLSEATNIMKSGNNFIHNALYYELDREELQKLKTYELAYRSTVHFTENGLVSSHLYGNFDNQDYIILDPLKKHVGVSDIRNYAGQDTFIKGNVRLSDQAIIIIRQDKYDDIKNSYPEIENFNVVLYVGISEESKQQYVDGSTDIMPEFYVNDQRAVVEKTLLDLGLVPELIGSHYIISSPTSKRIVDVNNDLGQKYGVLSNSKHNYSEEYEFDQKTSAFITDSFNKMLLDFILKFHNLSSTLFSTDRIDNTTAYVLLEILGVEAIILAIEHFNSTIERMASAQMLPTSGDFLNHPKLDIYNAYLKLSDVSDIDKQM